MKRENFKVAKVHTQNNSPVTSHSCQLRDKNYSGLDVFLVATLALAFLAFCVP